MEMAQLFCSLRRVQILLDFAEGWHVTTGHNVLVD
jgi:hypothetical protein